MSGGSDLIQTAAREAVSGQVTFQLYLADFPGGAVERKPGKETTCQCQGHGFDLWSRKIPQAEGN